MLAVVLVTAFVVFHGMVCAATFTVTNTNDSGNRSLRWAIDQANGNSGTDRIEFNIEPHGSVHTIKPNSGLPEIKDPVVIDGYSQDGASPATETDPATLMIELDGKTMQGMEPMA